MQKITPFLWFNKEAEEAARFYTSIFKNSRIVRTAYYSPSASEGSGMPKGSVMTVECDTQDEIDMYWSKLTAGGGKEVQCGWLEDKYGVSWQVVPAMLAKWTVDSDPDRVDRVMAALMKMKKLDMNELQKAYDRK